MVSSSRYSLKGASRAGSEERCDLKGTEHAISVARRNIKGPGRMVYGTRRMLKGVVDGVPRRMLMVQRRETKACGGARRHLPRQTMMLHQELTVPHNQPAVMRSYHKGSSAKCFLGVNASRDLEGSPAHDLTADQQLFKDNTDGMGH